MRPLARGTAPLGTAVLAGIFAVERMGTTQLASVGLILLGVAMFAFERRALATPRARTGVVLAVATGFIIACYTTLDRVGLRMAATPMSYIVWLFVLDGLFVSSIVTWVRRDTVLPFLRQNWKS